MIWVCGSDGQMLVATGAEFLHCGWFVSTLRRYPERFLVGSQRDMSAEHLSPQFVLCFMA